MIRSLAQKLACVGFRKELRPADDMRSCEGDDRGSVFGAEDHGQKAKSSMDLSNLHIQRYGDTAIASYTLLISTALPQGVKVAAHNESRVIVKLNGAWKVVHVHKSPAYPAPHVQP